MGYAWALRGVEPHQPGPTPQWERRVQSGKVAVPRVIVALCVWADESIQVSVTV
jgi:hypothetical protein